MKLPHTPRSLWLSNQPTHELPHLGSDAIVDVAIVGAGITGLTAALHLRRAGKSVLVLDAHRVAEGASGSTAAHLAEALDARYGHLEREFGEEGARLAAESTRAAIADIEEVAVTAGIPCAFARVPGFLYGDSTDKRELEAELGAATRAGVRVSLTDTPPLPFARAALRFEDQAQVHPREYLVGLTRHLVAGGVGIFERTRCIHVHERARNNRVITDRGVVHAAHVIHATHAPPAGLALEWSLTRSRSYVVAFAAPASVPAGLFWDLGHPQHTIRTQRIGDATLLLVGGEDHDQNVEVDPTERYERLAEFAQERFGALSIHFAWSSPVVTSADGLPYIGLAPGATSTYVATGFGGDGLTFGTLAGRIVSDAILGRPNKYAHLYAAVRAHAHGDDGKTPVSPRRHA